LTAFRFWKMIPKIRSIPTVILSWHSSALCGGSNKRTGSNTRLSATLTLRGADGDGDFGEDHTPETHLIPLVLDAAASRRSDDQIYGTDYPTPDGSCLLTTAVLGWF